MPTGIEHINSGRRPIHKTHMQWHATVADSSNTHHAHKHTPVISASSLDRNVELLPLSHLPSC